MFYASDIRFVYRSNQFSHRYSHRKLSPHQLHIRQQNIDFIQLIARNSHYFHVLTIVIKWLRVAHQIDTREVFAITICLGFLPVQALVYLAFCKEQQSYRLPEDTKSAGDLSFTTPSLARLDCKKIKIKRLEILYQRGNTQSVHLKYIHCHASFKVNNYKAT